MNIFSILDDSDNEESVKPKAPAKVAKDDKKPVVGAPPKKDSGNGKNAGQAKDRKPKDKKDVKGAVADEAVENAKPNPRGGKGQGKDHRKPKDKGDNPDGKRTFDRRSGTGRGREVSRGGRGPYGLGNDKQDALEAEKDPASAESPIDVDDGDEDPVVSAEAEEPEAETFTMDQFMAKRAEARAAASGVLATGKVRTVTKDETAGLTKGGEELTDFWAQTKGIKGDQKGKDQRSNSKNISLNVGFKFEKPDERDDRDQGRGKGRGGKGEGRDRRDGGRGDGRGRGRDNARGRGGRGRPQTVFNPTSQTDFPTL